MSSISLAHSWKSLADKINGLAKRERAIILVLSLTVLYMIWDLVILSPLANAKTAVDVSLNAVKQKIEAMDQEQKAILNLANSDPDQELKNQITHLNSELTALDVRLEELSLGLVSADQLSEILYDVLNKTDKLQLINMHTLPVEEVEMENGSTNSEINAGLDQNAGIYKHQVNVSVKGSFTQLMSYLQQLEQLHWRFYWEELIIKEDRYPTSIIDLKVYTLSTDEGLFGV